LIASAISTFERAPFMALRFRHTLDRVDLMRLRQARVSAYHLHGAMTQRISDFLQTCALRSEITCRRMTQQIVEAGDAPT
jgi:hypothetical protein